ncbi:MAG TPA: hypothetical protein VHS78_02825 [Candidatus Elarobacter sp.]|jgi:hypothetical protein|nr:hypothetical protein [Candidatus Elarobacter sp.]
MDVPAIRPQPPPVPRPASRAAAASTAKRPARAAPATPGDVEALARQSAFDAVAAAQAEQQREWNVLRDLAMQQVKRDDQVVGDWVKLI